MGEALRDHPGRFDFFQAVRVLERLMPGCEPVGRFGPPRREPVRFSVNNSLAFPPSQIHTLTWPEDARPTMAVNFFGLTGPLGVLPFSYTELLRDRIRSKDRSGADFFDLFNHRMISLFYQAWEKYRFFVGYERDQNDRLSAHLLSFVGIGTPGLQHRQRIRDESFIFYSGLLSLLPRSAAALEQLVADYFDVPAELDQFVGAWQSLGSDDCCALDAGRPNSDQMGLGAVAGELILQREQVPFCGLDAPAAPEPMLGWTTWMKSSPGFGRDPADAVFLIQ